MTFRNVDPMPCIQQLDYCSSNSAVTLFNRKEKFFRKGSASVFEVIIIHFIDFSYYALVIRIKQLIDTSGSLFTAFDAS